MPVSICSGSRSRLTVAGVCNGLLCLHDGYRINLWNPSTREVKLLPESTISLPPSVDSTYFYCMGLGFDRKSDDYKVLVNVVNRVHDEERIIAFKYISQIHLCSLSTESWREIPHPKVSFDRLKYLFNIYINGFCHYINGICHWPAFDDSGDLILSFDVAEEVFSTSCLPNFGIRPIASFNEALATIVHPIRGMEKCYDIWVLNGCLWTKQLTIGPILGVGRPLGFWKNGELFLERENHDLVMFDPCTGELQDFGIHMPMCSTQLVVYAESIVPIKGSSEYKANITREVKLPVKKLVSTASILFLNTDSWREIPHPNVYIYAPELFSTYLNEIYNWKAIDDDVGDLILSFDMAEDVFSTLPLPNFGMSNDECLWHITSFNEAAAVTVSPTTGMENKYDIWVLSGHSWTKQLTIGSIFGRPLAFWKNGELLLESENDTLVMFDTCTGELQDFGITCLSTQGS
ncbi:F-box and associated interaction domains-containing protein [Theobroma cacao]|uniref:F-box and associated interaction domains-containing protein n=1 Tax=Theobroma cacao TaxID=3641 RepID=A0A061FS78_THECC|nr:F-box and associated interaction domains-containing protein [Theobroma cacao]